MGVDARAVSRKMWASRFHCTVAILVMFGVLAVILAVTTELGLSRPAVIALEGIAGFSLFAFIFSEWIVVLIHNAERADPEKYERFHRLISETCKRRKVSVPRLYILTMESKIGEPIPNAVAFGMGLFGQKAVAVTERILELLDDDELKGVLDHELGHIASKDIGVMSVVQIVVGGSRSVGQLVASGKSPLGTTPLSAAVGVIILFANRLLFPIALSAVSQEREYAADAFAALQSGSPDPLISALRKIEVEFKGIKEREIAQDPEHKKSSPGTFDEMFLSHPVMTDRIRSLESLRS